MKKILIIIIILSIVFAFISCSDNSEPEISVDSFEIYLATSDSVREFGYYDYENLILKDEPILTDNDIRHYYWEQHIIELKGSFLEDVFNTSSQTYNDFSTDVHGLRQYNTGGSKFLATSQNMGFVIVINDEKIYSGTFPTGPELNSDEQEIVLGDISDDRLTIIYTGTNFDVRNNDSIYEFFNRNDKLAQMSGEDSNELVNDLQARLDESDKRYIELQNKYDLLATSEEEINYDCNKATVDWLKNRLDLYTLETQEGQNLQQFSDKLIELDLSDLESISEAADIFRQTAVASTEKNDRMFNIFEEMYYVIINSISYYNAIDEIDNEFINLAADNWIVVNTDGGKINAYPEVGKLRENFGVFLSPQLNEYLLIKDLERGVLDSFESPDFLIGDELMVDMNNLADFIHLWKKFTIDYPYAYPFNFKAQLESEKLMDIYVGKILLLESPIYDEDTLNVTDIAKESYERFISEYTETSYTQLISDFFNFLKENSFIYSKDVEEYVSNINYDNYR